jgi:peptidyl-prolyl cis-trans isomerase D
MARERASIAAISYVKLPYEMINDNEVKVSDDDIKAFMKKKENLLKSEEAMANADYVVFDIVPTADDSAASLGLLNKIRGEFDSTKNIEEFVNQYSEESMKDIFMSQDKLPADKAAEIMAAGVGTVIGPFLDNGSFKLVKVTDKKTLPDSVKASHILIGIGQQRSEEAAKLIIDSIETAIKGGANFEQMAATRSEDKGSAQKGGDLGYFGQGQMVTEFNDACFNGKVGDLKVVKTQFGYHLIRVQDQKDFKPGVKLATVVKALQSSEATIQAVYAKAAEFKSKANDSKSFAETAKKMSKDKRVASSITKTQQVLPGLGSAREISRWMFDAKIGEVSGVFNLSDKCVIANLTSRQEKGSLPDVATIRPQLEYYLKREKKGQMLMEKAKGKTSLDQIAALGATTVKNIDSLLLAGGGNDSLGYEPKVIGAAFNKALLTGLTHSPVIPLWVPIARPFDLRLFNDHISKY